MAVAKRFMGIPSPTVKIVCRRAASCKPGRFGVGCFRTAGEIARWRDASDDERRRIKAAARARARQAGVKGE